MPDFNPIKDAKHIMRVYRARRDPLADGKIGTLVDYIDALTAALRDAQQYVDMIAERDEDTSMSADTLLHTIRHLLDD